MRPDPNDPLTPVEAAIRRRRRWLLLVVAAMAAGVLYWLVAVNQYVVAQRDEAAHFLHGSIGAETANGLPTAVFRALPTLYRDRLGDEGWQRFGLIYDQDTDPLPIGFSRRVVSGVERVWFNCSVCHVGSYRMPGETTRHLIPGAPSNNLRLQELIAFLIEVGRDPAFTADRLMAAIDARAEEDAAAGIGEARPGWLSRLITRHIAFPRVQAAFQQVGERLAFIHRQQDWGPGRVDTFNPYKAIQFAFPMDPAHLPAAELDGSSDYPAIWQQRPREGMSLHWDGNNDSVAERNLSAALGAGVTPVTVDRPAIARIERWMRDLPAPRFPGPVDAAKAAEGARLYAATCAGCHGLATARPAALASAPLAGEGAPEAVYDYDRGRHPGLGLVVPLSAIGTDPGRWASYTREFAAAQNLLYAGTPWRFHRFRKTDGYVSQPLDGIWARSPYLHNGSVPTLRDLLEPASRRPAVWFRGSDLLDPARVGYRSDAAAPGRLFRYDTARPGNSNAGHEGRAYGTSLTASEKDAIVEYMKTL